MKNCYDWGDFSQEDKKKNFYNVNPKVNLTYKGAMVIFIHMMEILMYQLK